MRCQIDTVALAYDLEDLQIKTERAREVLAVYCPPDSPDDIASSHGPLDAPLADPSLPATKASRFSQSRQRISFARKKSSSSSSSEAPAHVLAETRVSAKRNGSIDSQATLVEPDAPHSKATPTAKQADDSHYLTLLAPLVATIQRLVPCILNLASTDSDLRASFLTRCEDLLELLQGLRKETLLDPFADPADTDCDDMRLLLLTALQKKVVAEKTRVSAPVRQISAGPGISSSTSQQDPFVLHQTNLVPLVSRTSSPPKRIAPAGPAAVGLQAGSFSDFMSASQASWRKDVHRLGSFQASALFSPSPIAVNRAIGAKRLA